ncbi:unnamed protein product [Ranitomeya imitator]|uniref:C2HC/C3H-type domain-containing protein n=1 Tax=Ranitomeya imitator TaxID=111125 RepID=A0ABN9LBP4_9NEOB|nr:unnamed protein product [Ranitomeya imitator]
MNAEEDSGLSLVESRQQYGGGRNASHPAVTQVEDTFHQLRLEAPGVQDIGRPSSGLLDEEILLYGNVPQNPGQPLVQCQLCGRRFMSHRLQKHAAVCQKTHTSRRKVFDSSKARAKGTDLEPYLHKKGNRTSPVPQVRVNSWRQKHESFLRTIRQARVVQDVIAKGGRISDLPPPPPEENPDYVSCPHCSRRFAPRAAERHIHKNWLHFRNHMGVPEAERQGSVPRKHQEVSSQSSLEVSVLPPAEDIPFIQSATCREKSSSVMA